MQQQTVGRCELCGKAFGKAGMARHIPVCRRRKPPETGPDALLLQVEGRGLPDYWLFLEVASTATWSHLDTFFRDTWVECCGHLSSFEAGGTTYVDDPVEAREWTDNARSLTGRIGRSLVPGERFLYTYDFGTSTELVGRALASVPALRAAPKVQVLARNDPPNRPCAGCGAPATRVCGLCYQETERDCWYCEGCASKHQCSDPGTDYFLPVVNSPRVGLCAYTGPDGP